MIRTGIGGWVYPEWRKGVFYPDGLAQKRAIRRNVEEIAQPGNIAGEHDLAPGGFGGKPRPGRVKR